MNGQSVLSGIFIRYGLTQAILLPLMLFSWFIIPRRASLRFQWVFHRILVVAAVSLPILLSLPGASSVAHAIGDRTIRAPVAATPMAGGPILTIAALLDRLPAALGTCSLLGLLGFLGIIGRQVVRERQIHAAASRHTRIGKISVVASDLVRSPFSTGLLRPRIYLPTGIAASSVRQRMVLAHEAIHVRNMHIAWTFVERLHAALFWYNPLAHLISTNGSRLRELLCDRGAGRLHGDVAYCRVLLDAAESLDSTPAIPGLSNAWIGRQFLRRRIEFIALRLGMTSRRWIFAAAPIAVLVSLVVFLGCGPRVLPAPASSRARSTSEAFTPIEMVPDDSRTPGNERQVVETLPRSTQVQEEHFQGTGYTAEGPAGSEGQTPPAYKDLSNLVGTYEKSVETQVQEEHFEGTGYNPEGPAGSEGQTPPTYKDLSNLVGKYDKSVETRNDEVNKTVTDTESRP